MTATDELRRMLDERGVAWFETAPLKTEWNGTGVLSDIGFQAIGELPPAPQYLLLDADHLFTPAQAIAATLGSSNCTNDCTNSERTGTLTAEQVMAIAGRHQPDYCSDTHVCFDWQAIADELNATLGDVPRLPHFWTHDGMLHIELPKLPNSISVLLPDVRDREVRSARVWCYTRDNGTCHECAGMDDVFECSACGGRYEGWALKRWARYCPDCGRRIEVDK